MQDKPTHPVNDHPIRGHFFTRSYLYILFEDPDKGQYYFQEKTNCPIYKKRLLDGQDWGELSGYCCSNPNAKRIAVHEAGHAAMCCLERIKLEYVTIEPSDSLADFTAGASDRRKDGGGLCQWDYGIVAKRYDNTPEELIEWCEKEVKMLLGGMMAEKRRYGPNVQPFHPEAWVCDEEMVRQRIDYLIKQTGMNPLERLVRAVESSFGNEAVWQGVNRIAEALVARGAIPGKKVECLFDG